MFLNRALKTIINVLSPKESRLYMASSNYEKAQELWTSFHQAVMFKQRFFISHPVLDMLASIAKKCEMKISSEEIFYRARIIDDSAAQKEHMVAKCFGADASDEDRKWYRNKTNKFRGLTKEGSYVPPNPMLIREARSNPKFIRYLYIAESPTTAVFEVRPILFNSVNVAGIVVKAPLLIANIAVDISFDSDQEKDLEIWLLRFVQSAFSSPTNNPDDYIPSQIIAEYFRHLGYDGIRYSSSLHKGGYNLTIFDPTKCEAVFSTDLRFEDMKISLRPSFGAENIDGRFEYIKDNIPMRLNPETHKLEEVKV